MGVGHLQEDIGVTEADGIKGVRGGGAGGDTSVAEIRRTAPKVLPKRRRAFHRAEKRGERWALWLRDLDPFRRALEEYFWGVDWVAELRKPSPWLVRLEKYDSWRGGYLPVPLKFETEPRLASTMGSSRWKRLWAAVARNWPGRRN